MTSGAVESDTKTDLVVRVKHQRRLVLRTGFEDARYDTQDRCGSHGAGENTLAQAVDETRNESVASLAALHMNRVEKPRSPMVVADNFPVHKFGNLYIHDSEKFREDKFEELRVHGFENFHVRYLTRSHLDKCPTIHCSPVISSDLGRIELPHSWTRILRNFYWRDFDTNCSPGISSGLGQTEAAHSWMRVLRNPHSQGFEMTKCSPETCSDLSPLVASHRWTRTVGKFRLHGFDMMKYSPVTSLGSGQVVVSHSSMRIAKETREYNCEMMEYFPVICLYLSLADASHG